MMQAGRNLDGMDHTTQWSGGFPHVYTFGGIPFIFFFRSFLGWGVLEDT